MNSIQPVGSALDKLELTVEQENENAEANTSVADTSQNSDDIIAIGSQALQRYQNEYSDTEAIDSDTAMQLLEQIQNASAQELEQVHQSLDPERVFKLVGLLD